MSKGRIFHDALTLEGLRRARGESLGPLAVPERGRDLVELDDMECGTRRKYEYRGCRCDACRAANAVHKAKYEKRYK